MIRKISIMALCLITMLSICACGPTEIRFGEEVPVSMLQDVDELRYTNENLPYNYNRDDFDGDGLNNIDETKHNTDLYSTDTDNDGIGDLDEVKYTGTDPTKFSSRDDGISDMEWWFSRTEDFTERWSATDASGFRVYLANPSDRVFAIKKVSTDEFDELETITEAYQISEFNGKMALDCSKYIEETHLMIGVSILRDGEIKSADIISRENGLISFEVKENDIFVGVYIG